MFLEKNNETSFNINCFNWTFNLRPQLPKLSFVWNVKIMFNISEVQGQHSNLRQTLVTRSLNTAIDSRKATPKLCISFYNEQNYHIYHQCYIVTSKVCSKTFTSGLKLDVFEYRAYYDPKQFVQNVKRNAFRKGTAELIKYRRGYSQPYHAVSIDPLRRSIKKTFSENNLAENFTPHSCRSVSTTKIFIMNLDIFGYTQERLLEQCQNVSGTF